MAAPNKVLPGFSASMWMQTGATPSVFTTANLAVWTAQVATIVGTAANGTGASGTQLNVEAVPAFGQDDAVASFTVAGSRQSDKIPAQSAPTSMTITAAWNPSDSGLLLIRGDAYSGVIDRTYVIAAVDGATTIAYAFNARASQFQIDAAPGAEAKCTFTLHPRGNQYGWSNT
jgi:Fe-S cluster assembly iron-binding protein IscA